MSFIFFDLKNKNQPVTNEITSPMLTFGGLQNSLPYSA